MLPFFAGVSTGTRLQGRLLQGKVGFPELVSRPRARFFQRQARHDQQQQQHHQQQRHQSQYRRPTGSGSSPLASLLTKWIRGPTFYRDITIVGAGGAGFYVYNLEKVPVSGRRRFNIVSEDYEKQMGVSTYRQVLQEYRGRLLPEHSREHQLVTRALRRLVPHAGLSSEHNQWEVHVIDDPQTNAFVVPGGKVFFFKGIFNVCQGEEGVAAVLGHEIAHNVARHSAEGMSRYFLLLPLVYIASALLNIGDLGDFVASTMTDLVFLKPGSRKQESEADYIGLMMMSQACYDPRAALKLWQRMEKLDKQAPPQFLSTHPSNNNRIAQISEWLDTAEAKRQESGCGPIASLASDFQDTMRLKW